MPVISTKNLDRLLKQRQELVRRGERQRQAYRQQQLKIKQDERNLSDLIENEQYDMLIKTLKQTKFPIEYRALLIGLALEAEDILNCPESEERTSLINRYTARYEAFMNTSPTDAGAVP